MDDDFDEGESDLEACVLHGNGSLAMAWCLWVGVERGNIGGDGDMMRQWEVVAGRLWSMALDLEVQGRMTHGRVI